MTSVPDEGWSRLHPLTPLLRGGRALVVTVGLVTSQGLRERPPLALVVGGVLLATLVTVVLGAISWRAMRYRLVEGELQVDSGVLTRRTRRVPLARVQSVDVVRPLVARALGLAELRLEVVGGSDTEAPLAYLTEADAHALRRRMLSGGGAESPDLLPAQERTDERVLVQVPTGALVTSLLLGAPVVLAVLVVPTLLALAVLAPSALAPAATALVPAVLTVGGLLVRRLLTDYGAVVAEVPEGLRLRSGLLETRSQTVPPGRVQTVRISEPLLWRRRGWVRVDVDVAGYAGGSREEQAATAALLPVAPRAVADAVLARVLGGPIPPALHGVPRSARWLDPLGARRLKVGLDDVHLASASGVLTTTTDVVPLAKVQSLRLTAGPLQRRLGLATLIADTAGRRLPRALLPHRSAGEAAGLLEELTARCRDARRRPPVAVPPVQDGPAPQGGAAGDGDAAPLAAPGTDPSAPTPPAAAAPDTAPPGPERRPPPRSDGFAVPR